MRFHIQCCLAFLATAQGFTSPPTYSTYSVSSNPSRNSLLVRHSTALQLENSWKDVTAFNSALSSVAEQCGNPRLPVISKAAECQEMWEDLAKADADVKPDTISLNTVLKAWNRCCSTLAESVRNHKAIPSDYKRSVDVYTPRDAAKRATALLLGQEGLSTDVASYNIVIGKNHTFVRNGSHFECLNFGGRVPSNRFFRCSNRYVGEKQGIGGTRSSRTSTEAVA